METNETLEAVETVEEESPGGLRKQLAEAHATIKKLNAEKMTVAFDAIGLDPNLGLGKAIAKEYDGDPSPEALAAYALEEYRYEGHKESDNPLAGEINSEARKLETVSQSAGSVVDPSQKDILAEAEATGDAQTSLAIKAQEVQGWFAGGQR